MTIDEGPAELVESATLDLADALLRDAEACAKRFERVSVVRQPTRADDPQLAVAEDAERAAQPGDPALAVDGVLDYLVRQRVLVDQKAHAGRRAAVFALDHRRVEGGVRR